MDFVSWDHYSMVSVTNQVTKELLSFQAPISLDHRDISASCSLEKVTSGQTATVVGVFQKWPRRNS